MAVTIRDMLGRTSLTPVNDALAILLRAISEVRTAKEEIPLSDALNRVLADDVYSPEDLPAWPRSTMDGFAVVAADTFGASQSSPAYLNIIGEVLMGKKPEIELSRGSCVKIPTGGLLPPGADAVVMHENTVPVDETLIEIVKDAGPGTAVMQKGEDVTIGKSIMTTGTKLNPYHLGLLAGLGITAVTVYNKPRVAILSTGDEIIPCSQQPEAGQIRDINAVSLAGLIEQCGAEPIQLGIVSDSKDIFYPALTNAVAENDMVLFSGGSSVGVRDLGERAIEELGDPGILVHGVTLKPGKPIIIGLHKKTPVFGLPGHPVSALICFETFVRPALTQLAGIRQIQHRTTVFATLNRNINSAAGRRDVVRVQLMRDQENQTFSAVPILGKSGSISSLSKADGYFIIDESSQGAYEGTIIEVTLFT